MAEEAALERWFHRRVRLLGGHTIKLAPIEAGTPDRLVMMPGGGMYLIEFKSAVGMLRPIQQLWHSKVARLGIKVYVLHTQEEAMEWLRLAVNEYQNLLDERKRRARKAGLTPVGERSE